jgi:hypothetical protein
MWTSSSSEYSWAEKFHDAIALDMADSLPGSSPGRVLSHDEPRGR